MADGVYLISELAELAGLAENTARRYARLFDGHFSGRQSGRVTRYPAEDAELLACIASWYKEGLSTPEVEEKLRSRGGTGRPVGDVDRRLDEVLAELAAQAGEMEDLRAELRRERALRERETTSLRGEIERLRSSKQELRRRLGTLANAVGPSDAFLCLPLVFQSEEEEFLGVSVRGKKHFTLTDFVDLVHRNGRSDRTLALGWEGGRAGWTLHITEYPGRPILEKHHHVRVSRRQTPKGNTVALIEELKVNGRLMPVIFLYELFKQISREGW
ncbi:MerR family transcriptional regulator [Desulfohalovibrio reitneri]|uniref:helix-turn-helix domain-containing protein n=1 Tax=Desulfohalovibrio reitneri TaxID=1307759 RepID=UPI0004A76B59|nr:MerR family transcriptional regulator [Desulfohalovibrio reitneri]